MFDSTLELAAHIPDSLKEGFEKPAMTIEEKDLEHMSHIFIALCHDRLS